VLQYFVEIIPLTASLCIRTFPDPTLEPLLTPMLKHFHLKSVREVGSVQMPLFSPDAVA
jgi:hypothetical protein